MQPPAGASSTGVSLTPTLSAPVWSDLGEVNQVILDYVETKQDVEVE